MIMYWLHGGCRPFFNEKDPIAAVKRAALESKRPPLTIISNPAVKTLIEQCWDAIPHNRPSFKRIYEMIEDIQTKTRGRSKSTVRRSIHAVRWRMSEGNGVS